MIDRLFLIGEGYKAKNPKGISLKGFKNINLFG